MLVSLGASLGMGNRQGMGALPACPTVREAASTGCVVVPCVTQGTLCMDDTPQVNVWAGQVVNLTPQDTQAYQQNTQAAASSATGTTVSTAQNSGTINAGDGSGSSTDSDGEPTHTNYPRDTPPNADDVSFGGGMDQTTSLLVIGAGAVLLMGLMGGMGRR